MDLNIRALLRLIKKTLTELEKNPTGGGNGFATYNIRNDVVRAELHLRDGALAHLLIDSEKEIARRAQLRAVPVESSRNPPPPAKKGRLAKRKRPPTDE